MNQRSRRAESRRRSPLKSGKYWVALLGVAAIALAAVVYLGQNQTGPGQQLTQQPQSTPGATPTPAPRKIVDFQMYDLNQGWVQYTDGIKTTNDGGLHWTDASAVPPTPSANPTDLSWLKPTATGPTTLTYNSKSYNVKKWQLLTGGIGWAQVADEGELGGVLLVTADGGATWNVEVTPAVQSAMDAERVKLNAYKQEAAMYAGPDKAQQSMQAAWTLLPAKASPGDVVLVRHNEAGTVEWQGKTYKLEPYGGGYFTYLPIAMNVKPGQYPIGGTKLTVQDKKFETQYLTVTKQMESMRQDTARIQADQKKIDKARSTSAPEFLFDSEFIQPIEGILTTPYGYTRYVNGKYDSSHRAIDLAAKEGTPIKATNDGVVALADNLYLTGNSIYIDHGMHLFSQYAHMSKLLVKTGDKVKKGDIIGLVGTTGFSTGPHLHFTFWAHNVPVNPNLFFNATPFRWLQ